MGDWIDVREAMRRSGLSRATLYRLIAAGKVRRAKRSGDLKAYVSASDLKDATSFRVVEPGERGHRRSGRRPNAS